MAHQQEWLSAGAPPDRIPACVERFRAVADMLPVEPGSVAQRLEDAVARLERSAADRGRA